jgi:hypothetical protein
MPWRRGTKPAACVGPLKIMGCVEIYVFVTHVIVFWRYACILLD